MKRREQGEKKKESTVVPTPIESKHLKRVVLAF